MKQISGLVAILNGYFGWNKARMDCFAKMLLSLFAVRTVNLSELAVGFAGNAQKNSNYRRLQRFFADYEIDMDKVAKFIFYLFFSSNKKVYLTVDRTDWGRGKSKINILTLAVAYEGLAIPLFWKVFPHKGNASGEEHKLIVKRFIDTFGKTLIAGVLGDREFANSTFFKWLNDNKIPFFIRVKEGSKVRFFFEKKFVVKKLFKGLELRQQTSYIQPVIIHGQTLFISAGRSETGEYLIVATNQSKTNAVSIYLRRWEIENLFEGLKSRGFRFEDTHLTKPERISKLMVLLSIAFAWAHKIGEWRAEIKPIRFNKFKHSIRPQNSYFRLGLDWLRRVVLKLSSHFKQFKLCLKQLILPDKPPFNPQMVTIS